MFGDLYEIGPQIVTQDLGLAPWRGAWNRIFGLLFIDQPVGTGFSISGDLQSLHDGPAKHESSMCQSCSPCRHGVHDADCN